jgi:glycerol-3-phosphate acyltransferase PlsY
MDGKDFFTIAAWLLGAYLIGAIPFGYLIGKSRGIDVRTVGSKNIGATNVFRTVGKKWGVMALLCDMLKGLVPTLLAKLFCDANTLPLKSLLPLLVGIACSVGHMLTPYIVNEQGKRFRGGKGVATTFGVLIALVPQLVAVAFLVFSVTFALSNMISLGSCVAALFMMVSIWFPCLGTKGFGDLPQAIMISLIALFVIFKHRSNIVRIAQGKENKIYLFKKK